MAQSTSSSRALNAILPLIASGQPYEAHQKARTFASRYQKSGQYDTAIDVLFQSARELLKVGQQGSGTDLASFLLDVYENKGETVNDDSRGTKCDRLREFTERNSLSGRLTQLIALTGPSGTWRKTIIDKAIAYVLVSFSIDCRIHGGIAGRRRLDHVLQATPRCINMSGICFTKVSPYSSGPVPQAHCYEVEGAFEAAEPHLLTSGKRDSARTLAQMYVDWSSTGGSPGAFALRGTIP